MKDFLRIVNSDGNEIYIKKSEITRIAIIATPGIGVSNIVISGLDINEDLIDNTEAKRVYALLTSVDGLLSEH